MNTENIRNGLKLLIPQLLATRNEVIEKGERFSLDHIEDPEKIVESICDKCQMDFHEFSPFYSMAVVYAIDFPEKRKYTKGEDHFCKSYISMMSGLQTDSQTYQDLSDFLSFGSVKRTKAALYWRRDVFLEGKPEQRKKKRTGTATVLETVPVPSVSPVTKATELTCESAPAAAEKPDLLDSFSDIIGSSEEIGVNPEGLFGDLAMVMRKLAEYNQLSSQPNLLIENERLKNTIAEQDLMMRKLTQSESSLQQSLMVHQEESYLMKKRMGDIEEMFGRFMLMSSREKLLYLNDYMEQLTKLIHSPLKTPEKGLKVQVDGSGVVQSVVKQ